MVRSKIEIGVGLVVAFAMVIWPDLPKLVMWSGLIVGVAIIFWGINDWRKSRKENPQSVPTWLLSWRFSHNGSWNFEFDGIWPFHRLIGLSKAAQQVYDATQDSVAGGMARGRLTGNKRLPGWYAHLLVGNGLIPMFGRRPHALHMVKIPDDNGLQFSDDATALMNTFSDSPQVTFESLAIRVSDFKRRLRELKQAYRG